MKKNDLSVIFGIYGDCPDFHFIAKDTGIMPTEHIFKGQLMKGKAGEIGRTYKKSAWELWSRIDEDWDVSLHFEDIYSQIEHEFDYFSSISLKFEVVIHVWAELYEGVHVGVVFEADVLEKFKSIRFSLDVSSYVLSSR